MPRRRLITWGKAEEAFKLLDSGEPFRKVASKLGVPKSTLYYWYRLWIEERVKELKEEKAKLEREILELKDKKASLEDEIKQREKEIENIKAIFRAQGLSWEEGMALIKQIRDLRKEKERLEKENKRLEEEVEEKAAEVGRLASECYHLRSELDNLKRAYAQLRYWPHWPR